jgi:hypothetical protein
MAAVIERTGYVSLAVKERTKAIVSLESTLRGCEVPVRISLGAFAALLATSAGDLGLFEGIWALCSMLTAIVFCYVVTDREQQVYVRLYTIGRALLLGSFAGVVLSGIASITGGTSVLSLPLMVLTLAGLLIALRLGRFVTAD